jgi:hypothetical protein
VSQSKPMHVRANSDLTLELGPATRGAPCECCATRSTTVHGFVYRAGEAFAVYHAGWTSSHPQLGVTLAIAIGAWDDDDDAGDRVAFGMEAFSTESEIRFALVEPDQSPWGDTALFGKLLSREHALRHPTLRQAFAVAELIVSDDARIRAVLRATPTASA